MTELMEDAIRQFNICNACRYCEGYCAVWDAIERQPSFLTSDMKYYSNLCHDCRECYYVCPYTDDHEFKLNIPKVLSELRLETYSENIWPRFAKKFLDHPIASWGTVASISIIFTFGLAVFLSGVKFLVSPSMLSEQIIPDPYFKVLSLLLYAYVIIIWSVEGMKYWHSIKKPGRKITLRYFLLGLKDAFQHKYFGGGGAGCNYPGEKGTTTRLVFHAMLLGGFILDLATILFYPDMGRVIVWSYTAGAAAMFLGSSFLLAFKPSSNQLLMATAMKQNDYPFTTAMMLTGLTGILFPIVSGTLLYSYFFLIHVALIAAIFLMAPYSKFLHPVFRVVSLAANRSEAESFTFEGS